MSGFGSVSGEALVIDNNHIFTDAAARDAYFPTHLNELTNLNGAHTYIAVGSGFERWDGLNNPASYDNTKWTDVTAIVTGPKGDKGDPGDPGDPGLIIDDTQVLTNKTYSSSKIVQELESLVKKYGDDGRVRFDDSIKHWFFEVQTSPGVWTQKFEIGGSAIVDVIRLIEGIKPTNIPANEIALYNRAITTSGGVETVRPELVLPGGDEYGLVVNDQQTDEIVFRRNDGTLGEVAKKDDLKESFTDLTDTPNDHNTAGVFNVVNNPFVQRLEYKEAELEDNKDVQISAPASGEILKYDAVNSKWINDEPRFAAALASFNIIDDFDDWQDAGISFIFANDNNIINQSTPAFTREGDIILVINANSQFGKTIVLSPRVGETINGGASYTIHHERIAFFVRRGTDWKFGGENTIVTTLTDHSVTELSDVTNAGSGAIITVAERAQIGVNTTDIAAIKVELAEEEAVFSYRGSSIPILPSSYRGEYYSKFLNLASALSVTLPDFAHNENGTKYGVTNEDNTYSVTVNAPAGYLIDGESSYAVPPNTFAYFVKKDDTRWVVGLNNESATVVASGITLDDGTTNIGGVTDINLEGARIEDQTGGTVKMKIGHDIGLQYGSYTQVLNVKTLDLRSPLSITQGQIGPGQPSPGVGIMEITPGVYEETRSPSFLAYLRDEEEIIGKTTDANFHRGILFFDDVRKGAGPFISVNRDYKAYGIQEWDNEDPNITGGDYFVVTFFIHMRGIAPNDGSVRFGLLDLGQNVENPSTTFFEDVDGRPLVAEIAFKAGENLQPDANKPYIISGIVKATAVNYMQCFVQDTFEDDLLLLADPTEGGTGLMIQALGVGDKLGDAFQQLELDQGVSITYSSHYIGADRMSINWLTQRPQAIEERPAGAGETLNDGYGFYNISAMKFGVVDGHLHFEDNGVDICDFNFHRIFSAEESQMMRGKPETFTETLIDKNNGWYVKLMKWTGKPDEYTKEIYTSRISDVPTYQANWVEVDSMFITEDVISGDHTQTKIFTYPNDGNNYAYMTYPAVAALPLLLKLKQFQADVSPAFIGWIEHYPTFGHEQHLIYDKEYKQFLQDNQGYAALRYTLNNTEQAAPCGIPGDGLADLTLDTTVNQIPGSNAKGGEGAIKVNAKGKLTFTTQLRLSNEQISASATTFHWAEVVGNPGSETYDKIVSTETTFQVPAGAKNILYRMNTLTVDAKVGDRFALRMITDSIDGAYMESDSPKLPMVQVNASLVDLVPGSEDDPLSILYVQDELQNDWELTAATDGHLQTLLVGDFPENIDHHVLRSNFSGNDFSIDISGGISLLEKLTKTTYTEIMADIELDDYQNYIVDTTSNTVTINIPYEQLSAFTVRDWKKEFDTFNCIITIRDALDAIVHTATLNNRDKGYIFYNEGGTENDWKYGEIGKGLVTAIASDHIASDDFGNIYTDTPTNDCRVFNVAVCYSDPADMMMVDGAFASKKYADDIAASYLHTMTIAPTATVEGLDVSSLSPVGTLFVGNAAIRDIRSFSGGVHGDIIHLVHTTPIDLKLKRSDSFTGQQLQMPNDADFIITKYGGCTLIFNSTTGYWHVTGLHY